MLDKSIEFHSIIMRCKNDHKPVVLPLPEGFSMHYYNSGDEQSWAEIETSVGEFESVEQGKECFKHYLNNLDELKKRQVYIVDESTGKYVATATAWFGKKGNDDIGVVHALSCLPQYQSKKLGKIAASYLMDCFYRLMPGKEIWLDTQTWSYKAIGIYLNLGFEVMKTATFNEVANEYDLAMKVLKGKMREDIYQRILLEAK